MQKQMAKRIKQKKTQQYGNHYSILRTIEDIYGLRYAGNATATSIEKSS